MAEVYPKLDRLKAQLLQSGIQQKNQPLYQVVNQLIDAVRQGFDVTASTTGGGGGGGGLINADYLTHENNLAILPNSRQLIAGSGISIMKTGSKVILNADGGILSDLNEREERSLDSGISIPGPRGATGLQGPQGPPGLDALVDECCESLPYIGNAIYDSGLQNYTPTWDQTTTSPSLGNSTLTGIWRRWGPLVSYNIAFQLGSTATLGTGAFEFTLPFVVGNSALGGPMAGTVSDVGTASYIGIPRFFTTSSILIAINLNPPTWVTETQPFSWVTGDSLNVSGMYFV